MKLTHALLTMLLVAVLGIALMFLRAEDGPGSRASGETQSNGLIDALLALAEPQSSDAAASPPLGGEVELCDYGRVKSDGDLDLPLTIKADAALAIERAATDLITRGTDRDLAFGLKLRVDAAMRMADANARRQTPECRENTDCAARLTENQSQASAAWAEPLARLALTTRDASAYAYAFHVCANPISSKYAASCSLISADRWAQLDPGNAAPWLYVASKAHERKDASALEYAAFQISKAQVSNVGWGADYVVMQSQAIQAQPRYTQLAIAIDLIGTTAAFPLQYLSALVAFCSTEQMRDESRKQLCSGIGNVLVEHDTSLIGFAVGTGIGERAGWPADRVARLREEREAMQAAELTVFLRDDFLSCSSFEKLNARLSAVARIGEVGAARALIRQSGRSTAELAQQHRQQINQLTDSAESALAQKAKAVPPLPGKILHP